MKKIISLAAALLIALSTSATTLAYIPYEDVYEIGDVDNSGSVTASDALLALQCAVGKISLGFDAEDAADIDLNWEITASDALSVLQGSVGKIELSRAETPYESYTLNDVEPTGLEEYGLYKIKTNGLHDVNTTRSYHILRLLVCMQGLINRNNDRHHVAVSLIMDASDTFWLDYMSEEGATYSNYNAKDITSYDQILETFMPFIKQQGIIAWDPNVPSTSNVALTVCGLDGYLPVMYSTEETSLYYTLTKTYGVKVKMNLCGMFEGAAEGENIEGTNIKSSGSAKDDAYLWAMENYMERCNPEMLGYTLDGAANVPSNPHYTTKDSSAQLCGIPNQDYFVMHQMFCFDLTSYPLEPASDDPTQPVGADSDTLKAILMKRYDMANGNFGIVQGFIPWHQKYTNRREPAGTLDAPRLEWHFVETVGCYNCGIEADAANPCWMSNGSLYAKYTMRNEPTANTAAKDITYDPETYYYCQVYSGDFDCSPWLKNRALEVWDPQYLGKVYSTFDYSTTHVNRIPQIFDYIYENRTEYEYLTGGEGAAYVMTAALFKGFVGKESGPTTRTLCDGDRSYYRYLRPYYDYLKMDLGGMLINGFSVMGKQELNVMNKIAVNGSFIYGTNAASQLQIYNGVPYVSRTINTAGNLENNDLCCINLRTNIVSNKASGFTAFGYLNNAVNYGTPKSLAAFIEDFEEYVAYKDPSRKYEYVDIETFFKLMAESGKGTVYIE